MVTKCDNKNIAIHAGLSMDELYRRQKGQCWLEVEMDEINGKHFFGDLYCTDGEYSATTSSLLNPGPECMKCIAAFVENLFSKDLDEED
jgi:hypothetical protein